MSARDLERLDHTADDFHEPSRGETDAEQATESAKHSPRDGGDKTRAHSQPLRSSTPGGRNGRPTPAAIEERRVRQALTETRGRVASSPRDLQSPGELWALAIQHLERAAVCLKTAAHRTQSPTAASTGHREAEQVRMLLDRVRPEQQVVDTHGTRRGIA